MLRHERIEAPQRCSNRHLVNRPIVIVIVIIGALHAATIRATCAGAKVRQSARSCTSATRISRSGRREAVDTWLARFAAGGTPRHHPVAGGASAEVETATDAGDRVSITVHARREPSAVLHVLAVACSEPKTGTACAPVFASVRVASDPGSEGNGWWSWVAIAGAVLVAIALVGWRRDLRKRA